MRESFVPFTPFGSVGGMVFDSVFDSVLLGVLVSLLLVALLFSGAVFGVVGGGMLLAVELFTVLSSLATTLALACLIWDQ